MIWRKVSLCFNTECVEVGWRKSSLSRSGNCVEVGQDASILVRDSKDPGGPVLEFTPDEWRAFIKECREGQL